MSGSIGQNELSKILADKSSNLNVYYFPATQGKPTKIPLIITFVDVSGSMAIAIDFITKYMNILSDKIKQHFGTHDKFMLYLFGDVLYEEPSKYMTATLQGGTNFTPVFQKVDEIIAATPIDQPIKILFISDGGSDWKSLKLGGHQKRDVTFLSIGVGSGFPFEASQEFYKAYHNSKLGNALFQINNKIQNPAADEISENAGEGDQSDNSKEAEQEDQTDQEDENDEFDDDDVRREFEAVEPYLFDTSSTLVLDKPVYRYPWSQTPETTVYEDSFLLSGEATLTLNKGQIIIKPQPSEDLATNLKKVQEDYYLRVMNMPSHEEQDKENKILIAKKAEQAISQIHDHAKVRVHDPEQLKILNTTVLNDNLSKVVDQTYFDLPEIERAKMNDAKVVEGTEKLDADAAHKKLEEEKLLKIKREQAAKQDQDKLLESEKQALDAAGRDELFRDSTLRSSLKLGIVDWLEADPRVAKLRNSTKIQVDAESFAIIQLVLMLIVLSIVPYTRELVHILVKFTGPLHTCIKLLRTRDLLLRDFLLKYLVITISAYLIESVMLFLYDWQSQISTLTFAWIYIASAIFAHMSPDSMKCFVEKAFSKWCTFLEVPFEPINGQAQKKGSFLTMETEQASEIF
jgi:hypothetical protein